MRRLSVNLLLFLIISCSNMMNPFELDELSDGIDHFYNTSPSHGLSYIYENPGGRITVYHGFNVSNSSKSSSDFLPWQTYEDFRIMKEEWGMNFIRLLLFWNAIEPKEDEWNLEYIERIKEIIGWCEELGIDVVIDFHKDVYGTTFENHGFPEWATEDENIVFNWDPKIHWSKHFLEPAVIRSFQNFWQSKELKGKYLRMMRFTLLTISDGNYTNIIGVDPMNEPFPHKIEPLEGDLLDQAFAAWNSIGNISEFEQYVMAPYYVQISNVFKSSGLNYRLFFEPVISTSAGLPSHIDRGYNPDPQDVYFSHYYQHSVYQGGRYPGEINKEILEASIKLKADEAKAMGVPLVFGEFAADPNGDGTIDYITDFLDLADYYGAGWAYYSYDTKNGSDFAPLENDKTPNAMLDALVRVFAPKIAGEKAIWHSERGRFLLRYKNSGLQMPTEIFIPAKLTNINVTINGYPHEVNLKGNFFEYYNDSKEYQEIIVEWDNY